MLIKDLDDLIYLIVLVARNHDRKYNMRKGMIRNSGANGCSSNCDNDNDGIDYEELFKKRYEMVIQDLAEEAED